MMEEESSSTEAGSDREGERKRSGGSINRRSSDEGDRRSTEVQHPPEKADKKKKKKKKSRKPSNSAFKQQRLKSCQPILTPIPVIVTLGFTCVVFVVLGIVILVTSLHIGEASVRYDNCSPNVNTFCNVTLELKEDIKAPVYVYYKLTNYYQNHRSYVKSRYDDQLNGKYSDSYSTLESHCDPLTSKGDSHNPDDFYIPCGLIALSLFNDTFVIYKPDGDVVPLTKKGIAWSSDKEYKFSNPPVDQLRGIHTVKDMKDEDFIVWMRTAGLPTFKKLWRKGDDDWPAGQYRIEIQNRYDVHGFDGEKWIVVGQSRWIGGRNDFLGIAFIVVGGLCGIVALVFLVKHVFCPRKLGDEKYLKWK
eukprot:TRINITY_DN4847_c0_g1_i1.p1 TRINITY_DN4847_c0_g1~~TRINITY_DN4847_c0_g1_i1.p1  ORF type:complete len:361 (+),score=69.38 TRINITY_DN4847_c0_g1_i1:197-1279(+)